MTIFKQDHIEELRAQIEVLRERRAQAPDDDARASVDDQIRQRLLAQGEVYTMIKEDK